MTMQANETPVSTQHFGDISTPAERPLGRAIKRGMLSRCPACGTGRLFKSFVKPVDHCAACGEDYTAQRADDLPPYIVITIVGHIIVGGLLLAEKFGEWPMWLHMTVWPLLTIVLSFVLMQPVKGGVVGLQWAVRMHGFGGEPDRPERQPLPPSDSRS